MVAYLGILCCFIPLILVLLIFTFKYKLKFTHQLLALLYGLIAVFPISVIQFFIPDFNILANTPVLASILKSLLLYGLIEEILKAALLLPVPHKNHTAQEFLLLSFVMGLSVACFESSVYYFDHLQVAASRGAILIYSQIFTRIFTSDLIHLSCTGLCGLFIYTCRQKSPAPMCLVNAILLHGIYDFFAGFQTNLRWFSIAVVILSLAECRLKFTTISQKED